MLVARQPVVQQSESQSVSVASGGASQFRQKFAIPILFGVAAFAGAAIIGILAGRIGSSQPIKQSVNTVVSSATVEMPDVVGIREAQARDVIRAKSLKVDVTTGSSLNIPAGHVASQYPAAGNGVPQGGTVRVRVSTGPPSGARPVPASGNTTIILPPGSSAVTTESSQTTPKPSVSASAPVYGYRLSDADLAGKSDWELDVMRNTIFARYGRTFGRRDLQEHFNRKSWYRPRSNFRESAMSALDKRNAAYIASYQAGARQTSNNYSSPSSEAPSYNYSLSASDLAGKSDWELDILRNTIYAKYGRIFQRSDLQSYFDRQSWYRRDSRFRESRLTPTEKRNVAFIVSYQKHH